MWEKDMEAYYRRQYIVRILEDEENGRVLINLTNHGPTLVPVEDLVPIDTQWANRKPYMDA